MSVSFGGADSISLARNVPLTGSRSAMAISAWCRPRNTTANMMIASFSIGPPPGTTSSARISLELSNGGTGNIQLRGRSADADAVRIVTAPGPQYEASEPFHVVGVMDYATSFGFIYVNGSLAIAEAPSGGAFSQSTTAATNSKVAAVGSRADSAGAQFFDGILEDVRLYGRLISEAEALTMFSTFGQDKILQDLLYQYPLQGQQGALVASPVAELMQQRGGTVSGTPTYDLNLTIPRRRTGRNPIGSF